MTPFESLIFSKNIKDYRDGYNDDNYPKYDFYSGLSSSIVFQLIFMA